MSAGLYTFLAGSIDKALAKYISTVSVSLATGITPLVVTGMSIWVLTYGYAVMQGEVEDPFKPFIKKVVTVSLICTFALSTGIYQDVIATGVNEFLAGMVQLVSGGNSSNFFEALDQAEEKMAQLAFVISGHGAVVGSLTDFVAGIIVHVATTLLLLVCGGYGLLGKIGLAFVLAFGPMFIAALAFPPTAKFFDAWFGKVMNYVFLITFMTAVSTFAIVIIQDYVDTIIQNVANDNALSDAFGLLTAVGGLIVVAYHMPQVAAALTGGSAMQGMGLGSMALGAFMGRRGGSENSPKKTSEGGSIENKGNSKLNTASRAAGQKVAAYQRARKNRK